MYYNNNNYLPQMNFSRVYPRVVVYEANFNKRDGEAGEILKSIPLSERDSNYMMDILSHKYCNVPLEDVSGFGYNIASQGKTTNAAIQDYKNDVRWLRRQFPGLSAEGRKRLIRDSYSRKKAREEQDKYNESLARTVKALTD
jgi:hypothetical protein